MNRIWSQTQIKRRMTCWVFALAALLVLPEKVLSDEAPQKPNASYFCRLNVGGEYESWDSNYVQPFNGREIWTPFTLSLFPWKGVQLYAQTEFGNGRYTDSLKNTQTQSLTGFTDTVAGLQMGFNAFSLPSALNIGFNLPTGDPTWETKASASNLPYDFIDSRYRGRGFGMSTLYGIALPAGQAQYGAAVGYMYSGAFNPNYGLGVPAEQLKLGDSVFLSLNRVTAHGTGQSDVIRLSAFYFLPTQANGTNLLQMGPNINASYGWQNPSAFSFEAGGQYFFTSQTLVNGQLMAESHSSLGPRFYLTPSYSFGNLTLAARAKYVLPNGYPNTDLFYDGGGVLLGLEPSFRVRLSHTSALKFKASFDNITAFEAGFDAAGSRTDIIYNRFTFGTDYELKL